MPLPQFVKFHNLAQIVAAFCGSQRPARIRPLDRDSEGFSGAVVIRVVSGADANGPEAEFCLRGWPPQSLPRERLLGLHRLIEHVFKSGVTQVAVPIKSQFGNTMHTEAGQFWQMEPWMPGVADFSTNPNETRLKNAMTVLAKWHAAATRFEARASEAEWFRAQPGALSPTVLDRLGRIQRFRTKDAAGLRQLVANTDHLEPWQAEFAELRDVSLRIVDRFDAAADRIAGELLPYRDQRLKLHPCLRDVWHDHVLFVGDEVTGLIDPSAARTETPATDLARLLGSLLGDNESRWQFAIAAYRDVRPLSDIEAKLARVIDRSTALLSGMTWLERLFVQRQVYSNPSRILDRLQQIVGRMDLLALPSKFLL